MAERVEILELLGFPSLVAGLFGVLEVTQSDMRAGVFTKDFLLSLSRVASENLQTRVDVRASDRTPHSKGRHSTPSHVLEG